MATKKFLREPKEYTTEPSADEVGHGMKRGGHAHHKKHHYAHGGEVESKKTHQAEMHEMKKIEKELKHHEGMKASKAHHGLKKGGLAPKAGPDQVGGLLGGIEATRHNPKRETAGVRAPGYKHGGKTHHISGHAEGGYEHHKAMAKHYAEKCKTGGTPHMHKMHEHHKHMAKMCKGGEMTKMASGGLAAKGDRFQTEGTLKPKINVYDKVVEAKQTKGFSTKTGKVRNTVAGEKDAGYKKGGHAKHHYAKGGTVSDSVAKRYEKTMMHDGVHSPMEKHTHKTGEIKQKPAGYKKGGHVKHHAHGGHVEHHTTHGHGDHGHAHMHQHASKHAHGHDKIDGHPMKRGGKAHHTSKVSTHMKKGGKCNY